MYSLRRRNWTIPILFSPRCSHSTQSQVICQIRYTASMMSSIPCFYDSPYVSQIGTTDKLPLKVISGAYWRKPIVIASCIMHHASRIPLIVTSHFWSWDSDDVVRSANRSEGESGRRASGRHLASCLRLVLKKGQKTRLRVYTPGEARLPRVWS